MTPLHATDLSIVTTLGLSALTLVFYLLYSWWKQERERYLERKLQIARERNRYLYSLIKSQQGWVTLLESGLSSGLSAEEPRNYLGKRAADFATLC